VCDQLTQYPAFEEEKCEWIGCIKLAFEQANRKYMTFWGSSIEENEETALSSQIVDEEIEERVNHKRLSGIRIIHGTSTKSDVTCFVDISYGVDRKCGIQREQRNE
jgi:hypothetical protein